MGVEPTTYGLRSRRSTTELTCLRPRLRPRAVHASAIRSAGAPGGTHEPAPLTRLPSRPWYGTVRLGLGRMRTRGRSRTCVLWVQSPTGIPATHGSCKWIRRQESDLRGLRSERSWDASNPHLSNWRASKELHPTSGLWRPVPRYEDRPKLGADGWICTSCLRITNALHISMCFNGENGTHGVSRTLATRLRRAGAEIPSAWVLNWHP